jgi:hypothetical protein
MGVSPIGVPQGLAQVLNSAGDKSNVDFDYLLQTAIRESSLNPEAKAPTSSAVGLFQFLESTWLQVMKEQGPRLGYGNYADAISVDRDGDYVVRDKALRREILALREDPQAAADLAAAFTQSNGAYLAEKFGKHPSPGELYIAHFLGPQGAERLFRAGISDPDQSAAALFPRQSRANPTIFYAGGEARSVRELYRTLVAKHLNESAPAPAVDSTTFAAQQLAQNPESRWPDEPVPSRLSGDMSFTSFFSTEAGRAPAPLIAREGLRSLVEPEVAAPLMAYAASGEPAPDPNLGFDPLPAPAPLIPAGAVPEAPQSPVVSDGVPAPRVLMSNQPNALFVTRLYDGGL